MHYRLDGREIKSENTAKPASQASASLVAWLQGMSAVERALDLGCGKLRYAPYLASRCRTFTLVDSQVQLCRKQRLFGETTTVREYSARVWPHSRVLSTAEFVHSSAKYDFILCANVLSAIPISSARSSLLRKIGNSLKKNGHCLFVSQYRNSYFEAVAQSEAAKPHLDGWLLTTPRGTFYYGILNTDRLAELASRHGLAVLAKWVTGQAAYVLAASSRHRGGWRRSPQNAKS
jgi:2-polyprenyl-3-methyl-5-hydroxy-6-metoxy-1,4-benzoquinol methylase